MIKRITRYYFSHAFQLNIQANLYRRKEEYNLISNQLPAINGHFTQAGSKIFEQNHNHSGYKQLIGIKGKISSIGVGTYHGSLDQKDDLTMFNGIVDSVKGGCNVIDTCRNFRAGRSQITVGKSLSYLFNSGVTRQQLLVSSKVGYVRDSIPKGCQSQVTNDHCVHPLFIKQQIETSLMNMGLKQMDIYYLNNFAQCQKSALTPQNFILRLEKAFETLEQLRVNNKIKWYGLSSWQAFRLPSGNKGHLSLDEIYRIAAKIGGKQNGFKFVQMPINIMMPQAFAEKYKDGSSFLQIAENNNINVISNSPLLSGSLINIPFLSSLVNCSNNGAKHLQLIRSIPSKNLVCTLIGQKLNRHVRKNLQVLSTNFLSEQQWLNVFVPSSTPKQVHEQSGQLA